MFQLSGFYRRGMSFGLTRNVHCSFHRSWRYSDPRQGKPIGTIRAEPFKDKHVLRACSLACFLFGRLLLTMRIKHRESPYQGLKKSSQTPGPPGTCRLRGSHKLKM